MKPAPIEKTVRAGSLSLAIRKYQDGRYGFDYHPPGGLRVKVRLRTIEEAEKRAKEMVGAAEAGKVERLSIDPEEYGEFLLWKAQRKRPAMVSQLVTAFLDAKEGKGRTPPTLRDLRGTLEPFAQAFPGPIAALSRSEVEKWLNDREIGPRRWNNMRSAICALHRFARMDGLLPAELTPVERMERRNVVLHVETYSPAEMRALLAVVPEEWLPLLVLGGFCGLRADEISPDPRNGGWKPGLRWEDIKWNKGKIDVPASVSKVRRRRFAPLTNAARSFLADYAKLRGPVVPPKDRHELTKAWAVAAKVDLKDNGMRHSFASYRLAVTKDAPALALEMGTSPAMIFRHYLDLKHDGEGKEWFAIRKVPSESITKRLKNVH